MMEPNDNIDMLKAQMKEDFFGLRDRLQNLKESNKFDNRALSVAITELETAQMWAVRSLFSDEQARGN